MIITILLIRSRGAVHPHRAKRAAARATLATKVCMSLVKGTEDREVRPSRRARVVVPVICSAALINSALDSRNHPLHSKMVDSQEMAWSTAFILS